VQAVEPHVGGAAYPAALHHAGPAVRAGVPAPGADAARARGGRLSAHRGRPGAGGDLAPARGLPRGRAVRTVPGSRAQRRPLLALAHPPRYDRRTMELPSAAGWFVFISLFFRPRFRGVVVGFARMAPRYRQSARAASGSS